ncbi:winged helix-turn-helix transcriptional regulator [Candidatus Woesearchaeota archaeon]|nr:winged helix-turn-helix transcriptional regulator [Candidatus Woesearchaeota archaeon]
MVKDKFILLNIEDPKSKELAQVISSNTSRKILDILAEQDLSETEISKKLNLPLSTTHYNTQQLLNANIIEKKGFMWSDKGKKIYIYKLANKLIIIAPKNQSSNFYEKLKEIIPMFTIGTLASIGIYLYQNITKSRDLFGGSQLTNIVVDNELEAAKSFATEIATSEPNYALFFFLGVLSLTLLYLIFSYWKSKKYPRY